MREPGLNEARCMEAEDVSFEIVSVENEHADFQLQLTWLKTMNRLYDLWDEEFHPAFRTDDFEDVHKFHEEMVGIVC